MQQACFQIDLVPAQRDELRDAKAVTVGNQDQRAIARTMAADPARGLQELLDLVGGQVFALAPRGIGLAGRGRGEPQVAAERRSTGFLLRRREATFPFTSVGAAFTAAGFPEAFSMPGSLTLQFRVLYGQVQ